MKIAFLGLGAMGSRMALRLLAAGYDVAVWNRTPMVGSDLPETGAVVSPSPAEAAASSDIVFSMVRDDAASNRVWFAPDGAAGALKAEAIAVECSTVSVPHIRSLAAQMEEAGHRFVEAPLAGSRPQAEAGQLIFFAGGAEAEVKAIQEALLAMGSTVHHAGPVGSGAVVKLMVNALFGSQLAMIGELIGFAAKNGLDPVRAVEILTATPVTSPAAQLAAGAMLKKAFAPAFPIDLVAKDFDLLARSAGDANAPTPLSAATGSIYREAVQEGFGNDNITGIVQRFWSSEDV